MSSDRPWLVPLTEVKVTEGSRPVSEASARRVAPSVARGPRLQILSPSRTCIRQSTVEIATRLDLGELSAASGLGPTHAAWRSLMRCSEAAALFRVEAAPAPWLTICSCAFCTDSVTLTVWNLSLHRLYVLAELLSLYFSARSPWTRAARSEVCSRLNSP